MERSNYHVTTYSVYWCVSVRPVSLQKQRDVQKTRLTAITDRHRGAVFDFPDIVLGTGAYATDIYMSISHLFFLTIRKNTILLQGPADFFMK